MRAMGRSSDSKSRKVTPPSPSYMSNDQFASYLSELRSNRMSRPSGARPQPAGARPAPSRSSLGRSSIDAASQAESHASAVPQSQRAASNAPSVSSRYSRSSLNGRGYYAAPDAAPEPLKSNDVVPTHTYMERGQRWMEKEEAFSLREAMEEMDLRDAPKPADSDEEENRIHNAALDEAAELVWQHQNPGKVRQPDGPYRYRPHLRKNSYAHARAASISRHGDDIAAGGLSGDGASRSVSGSSSESGGGSRRTRPSFDSSGSRYTSRSYGSLGSRTEAPTHPRRRSSMKRNISGEVNRPFSGDQIWEEPETAPSHTSARAGRTSPDKLGSKDLNHVRFENPHHGSVVQKPHNRVEIHHNPPTRSRDAQYRSNANVASTPAGDSVEMKNGVEVRSQDIREATSMRLKDRSPKLPEPTAVSDSPGRPIVSFNADWRAPDEPTDTKPEQEGTTPSPPRGNFRSSPQPQSQPPPLVIPSISVEEDRTPRTRPSPDANIPSISVAGPEPAASTSIPTIAVEESSRRPLPSVNVPTIAVEDPSGGGSGGRCPIPTICLPGEEPAGPAPGAGPPSRRPQPQPPTTQAQRPRGHWSRASGTAGVPGKGLTICHECCYPIEGRFVALAGVPERFHPQCLRCFTCGTSLEAMEISPEPQQVRDERIGRISRRAAGEILDETPGMTMAEDGDERLRFYCHLDWHELFAPRCKHCQTPILGEHIVALGQHWHYGHFFCAECGDPFGQGMTHIEKDGYAWCINCQTKRTERRAPKCRKCRAAVVGEYIQALGGEWHEHCFRCAECQGSFDDGQIFPKDLPGGLTVVLCTPCRARELKR